MSAVLLLAASFSCGPKPHRGAAPPFGAFDFPPNGARVSGPTFAAGWALAEDGVAEVDVYLDRTFLQDATLKIKRPDVLKVYPAFKKTDEVGWTTDLHAETLPVGKHELLVRIKARSGLVTDLEPHNILISH